MILPITGKVGDFIDSETLTGETSEATGIVVTHMLRCQDEVNPVDVKEPIYFKAVFEPEGLPSPTTGILLTNVVGTFQNDEKVIGQTSGAYAWVASVYYSTYDEETIDPKRVWCRGTDTKPACYESYPPLVSVAMDEYRANPSYNTDAINRIGIHCSGIPLFYYIKSHKMYFDFDTTGADANPTSAKLRVYLDDLGFTGLGGNPTMRAYSQDWGDVVDMGDWLGGTLEDGKEIAAGNENSWIEFDVSIESVNIGGHSKYKISIKELDDDTLYVPNGWWLEITDAQLKLGYNEL